MSPRPLRPRPRVTRFTEPFWEGTRLGELRLQRCDACGRFRWTPQLACPLCWSERFRWIATSGRGSVYSYTRIERPQDPRAFPEPYVLAVVELEEGVHLLTNLVDCAPELLRIGLPVEVRFERLDDEISVYPFAPRSASSAD